MKQIKPAQAQLISRRERYALQMHIPLEFAKGNIFVNLMGKTELYVENYVRILEYTDQLIRIKSNSGELNISGKNLEIVYYNDTDMWIKGIITTICYPQPEEPKWG